jgi:hypothetical protein
MFLDQQVTYAFKNETGEEIPPYGVVVIEGATLEEGQIVFSVRKPTASDEIDQEPASVLFNAIQPVPDGLFGVGTRTLPVQALVEQPSSDHPSGLAVGLKDDSFALAEGGSCFKILAKDLTDPHIQSGHGVYFVEGYHGKTDFHIGITTSAITAFSGGVLGSGTVMLKAISSSNTLINDKEITMKNPSSAIATAKLVFVWRTRKDYCGVEVC